jgi:hypothetical protein
MLRDMHIRRITVLAASVLAATAIAAPEALGGFSSPSTPVAAGELLNTSDDPIAIDGSGRATVAWYRDIGNDGAVVKARRISPTGTAGQVLTLSVPGERSIEPAVASASGGRSFVAWRTGKFNDPEGVKGRWIEANGTLGPVLTLLAANPADDAVELNAVISNAGVATVTWVNGKDGNKLALRRVAADGSLGTPIPDISGGGGANEPKLVALPNGTTVAVWRDTQIEGNVVSPTGVVGTVASISETCGLCASPGLAVDANGDGMVAWRWSDGDNYAVIARRLTQTGAPTASELIVDAASSAFVGISVPVAADTQDDFIIAWNRQNAAGREIAWARRLDETGTFAGPAQAFSGPDSARLPAPALMDRGNAAVAWATNKTGGGTIGTRGRVLGANATPLAPKVDLVAKAYSVAGASAPAAGVAAFLSEGSTSGSARRIDLNRFLVTPICASSQATVVQGKAIAAPLDCTGPAIERVVITSAPKHGRLGAFSSSGPTVLYTPKPGYAGPDSFSYRAVNDGGQSNIATVQITVGKDTVAPVVNKLELTTGKKSPGKPRPLFFELAYSERSTATVSVRKRQANGKFKEIGSLRTNELRRRASLRITGELLVQIRAGGSFRAFAVATDAAGNGSTPRRLDFTR